MINWSQAPEWAAYAAINRSGDIVYLSASDLRTVAKRENLDNQLPPGDDEAVSIDARVDVSINHRIGSKMGAIAKYVDKMRPGDKLRISAIIDKDGVNGTQKRNQVLLHRFLGDRGVFRVQYYKKDLVVTCLSLF